MGNKTDFHRKLDDLWSRRTEELRALVGIRHRGPRLKFNKKIREQRIRELTELATEILREDAKDEIEARLNQTGRRHIRGYGIQDRFDRIWDWAESWIRGPIVYLFWKGSRCLYVGRGNSWKRLGSYEKSWYLKEADLLEVLCVAGKSNLPLVECLCVHLYEPRDNKSKPANKKWGKSCPICLTHDRIQDELRFVFAT
ncbi:MAG: hypothetical protein AAB074_21155 [Planctomycetota bacterium]